MKYLNRMGSFLNYEKTRFTRSLVKITMKNETTFEIKTQCKK